MLNGVRMSNGSALASVPLHAVREAGGAAEAHFVEAFYSSDARSWLLRSGTDPAGPSAGTRLRRWESLGIVQRVVKVGCCACSCISMIPHVGGARFTPVRFSSRYGSVQFGSRSGWV